jgi:hypothetical protein
MATITHSGTLPDSSNKTDFYSIIDNATITSIVNADIAAGAAIADSKLAAITTTNKVNRSAIYGDTGAIEIIFDGGGSAIASGSTLDIMIPFACTVTSAYALFNQGEKAHIDIWKTTYALYDNSTHPVVGDTICSTASGSTELNTLSSSANKVTAAISPAWTTSIAAQDVLRFYVSSSSSATRALAVLKYSRP